MVQEKPGRGEEPAEEDEEDDLVDVDKKAHVARVLLPYGFSPKLVFSAHRSRPPVSAVVSICRRVSCSLALLWIFFKMVLIPLLAACSLYVGTAVSVPVADAYDVSGAPVVTVKNGTYSGIYSDEYDQDFFLGMPYAQVCVLYMAKNSPRDHTPGFPISSSGLVLRQSFSPHLASCTLCCSRVPQHNMG